MTVLAGVVGTIAVSVCIAAWCAAAKSNLFSVCVVGDVTLYSNLHIEDAGQPCKALLWSQVHRAE
eukprot:5115575-Amphidinium_carterae.1